MCLCFCSGSPQNAPFYSYYGIPKSNLRQVLNLMDDREVKAYVTPGEEVYHAIFPTIFRFPTSMRPSEIPSKSLRLLCVPDWSHFTLTYLVAHRTNTFSSFMSRKRGSMEGGHRKEPRRTRLWVSKVLHLKRPWIVRQCASVWKNTEGTTYHGLLMCFVRSALK